MGVCEAIILESLSQLELRKLSGRRVRKLVNELDRVRHPPGRHMLPKVADDLVSADVAAVGADDAEQRPLVPQRMRDSDGSRFGHTRKRYGGILQLDRADP